MKVHLISEASQNWALSTHGKLPQSGNNANWYLVSDCCGAIQDFKGDCINLRIEPFGNACICYKCLSVRHITETRGTIKVEIRLNRNFGQGRETDGLYYLIRLWLIKHQPKRKEEYENFCKSHSLLIGRQMMFREQWHFAKIFFGLRNYKKLEI